MFKPVSAAAILFLALSSTAIAQSVGEKTGVNAVLGVAPSTADFVKEAAMSDMTEIATSKLAQERGDADAKAFAAQMVTDHTKTSEELKALVTAGVKAEIPASLDDAHQKKVDKLKDAVSLFERYAKGGDDANLKDWAGRTLPHLQHHLEMAQTLNKKK